MPSKDKKKDAPKRGGAGNHIMLMRLWKVNRIHCIIWFAKSRLQKNPDDDLNVLLFSLSSRLMGVKISVSRSTCAGIHLLLSFETKSAKWRVPVPYSDLEMTTHGKTSG